MQNQVEGFGDVHDVNERPLVGPITVHRQSHPAVKPVDELGDKLFGVLSWPVNVVTARDYDRELEGVHVGFHKVFRCRLSSSVGIGGIQSNLFGFCHVVLYRAVDLVR